MDIVLVVDSESCLDAWEIRPRLWVESGLPDEEQKGRHLFLL